MVVGGGGREQALYWKLAQSARIGDLHLVPVADALAFAADPENNIHFAVIGPDDALADGMVDKLTGLGVPAFGPSKKAAQIEASKAFAKQVMDENGIPTAQFGTFTDPAAAHAHLEANPGPKYVKASGLALGKGALECLDDAAAHTAVDDLMVRRIFGEAGDEVVIEDYLQGRELSLHALADGQNYLMFQLAADHKKALEGNKGLNTGGMGTLSPVPGFSEADVTEAGLVVVKPTLAALERAGAPFQGLLYPGVIFNGLHRVLEFNGRFGDTETQTYMRRLDSDLLEALIATVTHRLDKVKLDWSDKFAVCIVAASGGYPGSYEKGKRITGVDRAEAKPGIKVFLAGAAEQNGELFTNGGRVLGVTAMGDTLAEALDAGYGAMEEIQFEGKHVRGDIGQTFLTV
ncbi:MAG TPA: phosphoribosylamine--glycine ligase [Candidatus Saccharimonadales bacterium]|nr:phosphoribosylamine--glycine ligase [Candidatus Saccharimonadales bacterium]